MMPPLMPSLQAAAVWLLLVAALPAAPAGAETRLVVATWNIAWLGDGVNDEVLTGNREGRHLRGEREYRRLGAVVDRLVALGVEVVGLQEIENAAAARRIFPADAWEVHVSSRDPAAAWAQRTAIAVRRTSGWSVVRNPDIVEWSPQGRDRYGVNLTLTRGTERVRVLTIHFQSGCNTGPLSRGDSRCGFLRMQVAVLIGWLHGQIGDGIPIVVAGDWNRTLSRAGDEVVARLPFDPVVLPPPGSAPSCWESRFPHYIDHLLAFAPPGMRAEAGWVEEVRYDAPPGYAGSLSDHCPIVGAFRFRP